MTNSEFEGLMPPGQVDERFGVLLPQQVEDERRIVGVNTLGHYAGSPPPPGQGRMDQAALDALNPIPPHIPLDVTRRQRFDQLLSAVDQFAKNYEDNLVELRNTDPARFNTHFAHLAKTNLPRSVPDPTLGPGFTTVEAALLRAGNPPPVQRRSNVVGEPFHMTEEEFRQRKREERERMLALMSGPPPVSRKPSLSENAPQPWKEVR